MLDKHSKGFVYLLISRKQMPGIFLIDTFLDKIVENNTHEKKMDAKKVPASINSLGVLFINMGTSFCVGAFLVGFQVSYSCF